MGIVHFKSSEIAFLSGFLFTNRLYLPLNFKQAICRSSSFARASRTGFTYTHRWMQGENERENERERERERERAIGREREIERRYERWNAV